MFIFTFLLLQIHVVFTSYSFKYLNFQQHFVFQMESQINQHVIHNHNHSTLVNFRANMANGQPAASSSEQMDLERQAGLPDDVRQRIEAVSKEYVLLTCGVS